MRVYKLITENIYDSLIDALNEYSSEIVSILKSLGNEYRFQILLQLLNGAKSFKKIVKDTEREKTAVANHLIRLLKALFMLKRLVNTGRYMTTIVIRQDISLLVSMNSRLSLFFLL